MNKHIADEQFIDKLPSNRPGINIQGINKQGINIQGINKQGINKQGINKQGINIQGINIQGINIPAIEKPPADKPIIVVRNNNDANIFIDDCRKLHDMNNERKGADAAPGSFCGIDFEFNMNWRTRERYIAMMQIIFVFNDMTYYTPEIKPIYILDPLSLSPEHKQKFTQYILCSSVTKIFHGSDSLDYPHVYSSLLNKSEKKFIKFINHSVDTRFLCEISKRLMVRAGMLKLTDKKCSIYNALLDHNVIDRKKFDTLTQISSTINYNKDWIISKLKPPQLMYSAYDVMYLYDLLHIITKNIRPTDQEQPARISIDPLSSTDIISVITRLYRFHMINRLALSQTVSQCKLLVGSSRVDLQACKLEYSIVSPK